MECNSQTGSSGGILSMSAMAASGIDIVAFVSYSTWAVVDDQT